MSAEVIAVTLTALGCGVLFLSLYVARLAGGSWSWAAWGIFGPLGWIAAFALSGAMKAHEREDRRVRWEARRVRRTRRRLSRSSS